MSIICFIQARMSSSRLPNKVLLNVLDKPMLGYMIERLQHSKKINQIIVLTSTDLTDDPVYTFCQNKGVECYRGDLDDVLDRYHNAAVKYDSEHIIRLTADCPLSDPELIDNIVTFYMNHGYDYVSNGINRTFPDGFDVEIFSYEALARAFKHSSKASEREHVTPYITKHPDLFHLGSYEADSDYSKYRVTVDYPEDIAVIREIAYALRAKNQYSWLDVVSYLNKNPSISVMNSMYQCNEGYLKSLREDEVAE